MFEMSFMAFIKIALDKIQSVKIVEKYGNGFLMKKYPQNLTVYIIAYLKAALIRLPTNFNEV